MKVTAFRVWNFMGFRDSDWVELRPICLLFGRNSSGKSALLRSLQILKQSLDTSSEFGPILFSVEGGVDAGTYRDVIHAKDVKHSLSFGFKCEIDDNSAGDLEILEYLEAGNENHVEISLRLVFYFDDKVQRVKLQEVLINLLSDSSGTVNDPVIFSGHQDKTGWEFYSDFLREHEQDDWESIWPYVSIITTRGFFPRLIVQKGSIDDASGFGDDFNFVASTLITKLGNSIEIFLRSIEYLGPMRDRPERYYRVPDGDTKLSSLRILHNLCETETKKTTINSWLAQLGLEAEVSVNQLGLIDKTKLKKIADDKSLSFSDKVRDAFVQSPFFEVVFSEVRTPDINLHDVGFGVSQVLPLIIASTNLGSNSPLLIEQPELHLHPSAQAELGDLFIQMSKEGVRLVIETHSENLLLRLRRRLAQTTGKVSEAEEVSLTSDEFVAYFVDRKNGVSEVEPLRFDQWGDYVDRPQGFGDFFGKDFEELLKMKKARSGRA